MEDLTVLLMQFETRHKKALNSYKNKRYSEAKEEYLKAAELMYTVAQKSTKQLKAVRLEKAKKLILIAHQIDQGKTPSDATQNLTQTPNDTSDSALKIADVPNISFDDIVGLDDVKKTIFTQMILPIKHPDKYGIYKKRSGGGVLLFGPPGTGKTTIAKAIANEVGASFYLVKGSDILNKYVGESEKNIAQLFNAAKKETLAIIFIDDMDSLFMRRGQDIHNDERVNEFLQQIDGFSGQATNVLLLGATNRPWAIDSAIKRPGRFSRHIYIPLPDEKARYHMFEKFLEDVPLDTNVDVEALVTLTAYYSGADIFELCDQAKVEPLMQSIQTNDVVKITQKDFIDALRTVKPSVDRFELKKFNEYTKSTTNEKSEDTQSKPHKPESKDDAKSAPTNDENQDKKDDYNATISDISVTHHDTVVPLEIGKKPTIRFALSNDVDQPSIMIDTKRYICNKEMTHYKSDSLDIDSSGDYKVSIYSKDTCVSHFSVRFTKGIIEKDMGL